MTPEHEQDRATLLAQIKELRGALEPFALAANLDGKVAGADRLRLLRGMISLEDFAAAKQALGAPE